MKHGTRAAAACLLMAALSIAAPPAAGADELRDTLLRLFYGGKVGLSLLAAGTALTEPEGSVQERVVVGASSALVGLSSGMVLLQARRGSPTALRRWRIASFAVDAALSALAIGAGVRLWADPDSSMSDDYAGLALVTLGLAGAVVCSADLVPFEAERR